jgi:hypothetical protein
MLDGVEQSGHHMPLQPYHWGMSFPCPLNRRVGESRANLDFWRSETSLSPAGISVLDHPAHALITMVCADLPPYVYM